MQYRNPRRSWSWFQKVHQGLRRTPKRIGKQLPDQAGYRYPEHNRQEKYRAIQHIPFELFINKDGHEQPYCVLNHNHRYGKI